MHSVSTLTCLVTNLWWQVRYYMLRPFSFCLVPLSQSHTWKNIFLPLLPLFFFFLFLFHIDTAYKSKFTCATIRLTHFHMPSLNKMHLQSSGEFHTIAGSCKSTKYFITVLKKISYFRYLYLTWVFIFRITFSFDSLHLDTNICSFFVVHQHWYNFGPHTDSKHSQIYRKMCQQQHFIEVCYFFLINSSFQLHGALVPVGLHHF